MVLLGFTIACVAFGAVTVVHGSAPDLVRRQSLEAAVVAVLVPATVATLLPVTPTGLVLWDAALLGGFTGLLGLASSRADRRVLLAATAAVAVAAAIGSAAIPAAAGALGVAGAVTALGLRLPAPKALAGGLLALALLELDWPSGLAPRTAASTALVLAVAGSGLARLPARTRARWLAAGGGLAVAALLASAGFALQALRARDGLEDAVDVARTGLAAARDGHLAEATAALAGAERGFGTARRSLDGWLTQPARLVPGLAQNRRAMAGLAAAGEDLAAASVDASVEVDVQDLRLREGRLDLAQLAAARRGLSEVAGLVRTSTEELRATRSPLLVPVVADAVDRFTARLHQAGSSTDAALEIVRVLPGLLGEDGERRWFLGLQAVSEARATGGIIGSHGILTATGGRLALGPVGRTAELNSAGDVGSRRLVGPPDYVRRYARYEPERTWQNLTLSPDGPSVAQVVEGLYPQTGNGEVDGVLLVDHVGLAALLRLTGPVSVPTWPEPLTADNIGRILLHEQYLRYPVPERVDFLADAARAVFDRIAGGELPDPATLAAVLGEAAEGRHLVAHSRRPREQALFERLGLTGALPPVAGDALALVTQNASGNKIDWFLRRHLTYRAEVDPATGAVTATATVRLRNLAPASGLPHYVIGGTGPNPTRRGENRMLLSLYTPLELEAAAVDGRPVALRSERELGRFVHGTTLTIPPGGEVVVELRLRGAVPTGGRYVLDVRAQPTVTPDEVVVDVRSPAGPVAEARFAADRDRRITADLDG